MNEQTTKPNVPHAHVVVEKQAGSMIKITGEIPLEAVHLHRMRALRTLMASFELPGFRKGHVPEDMVLAQIGEMSLLEDATKTALSDAYVAIVEEQKLAVLGHPEVTVTQLAPGLPIGFSIVSAVYPDVVLPDYVKLAEKERVKHPDPETVTIADEDVDAEVARLQKIVAGTAMNADEATASEALPEPDDVFARSLGDFADLADLKAKIAKGMKMDKQEKARDKKRLAIVEGILAKTECEVPKVLVETELDQMVEGFKDRAHRAGLEWEQYLTTIEKTIEDLRKEWLPDAEKRAKMQIMFGELAKKEGIVPEQGAFEREVAHVLEHYTDAEEEAVKSYVRMQMTNERVLAFLEGSAPETPSEAK
jgi:FKBP-type peptidyl-prolyl cis-trans isomerase (trigger factor)